jgi:hypothetical protein
MALVVVASWTVFLATLFMRSSALSLWPLPGVHPGMGHPVCITFIMIRIILIVGISG